MNKIATSLMCVCMAFAAGSVAAQDAMKKNDGMMKKDMTMQECKDHMAMAKQAGAKKDDAAMKKDAMCADMMKKDGMKDGSAMPKDAMPKK